MTLKSSTFRGIAAQMLSDDREVRDQACLDFRVIRAEMDPDEVTSLSVLLAHVLVDEPDAEIREEELYALAQTATLGQLPDAARRLVRQRGVRGLDDNELVSWHDIVGDAS